MRSLLSILLLSVLLTGTPRAEQVEETVADDPMVELTGVVIDPSRPLGRMVIDDREVVLHLGPHWFWDEHDLYLERGEELTVTGEIELVDGVSHIYPNRIELEDRIIVLASDSGIPRWARGHRGRQMERGQGENSGSQGGEQGRRRHGQGSGNSWGR